MNIEDSAKVMKCLELLKDQGFAITFAQIMGKEAVKLTIDSRSYVWVPANDVGTWSVEDVVRGFIEREMQRRGFWPDFHAHLLDSLPQLEVFPPRPVARSTFLEFLSCAVGVFE